MISNAKEQCLPRVGVPPMVSAEPAIRYHNLKFPRVIQSMATIHSRIPTIRRNGKFLPRVVLGTTIPPFQLRWRIWGSPLLMTLMDSNRTLTVELCNITEVEARPSQASSLAQGFRVREGDVMADPAGVMRVVEAHWACQQMDLTLGKRVVWVGFGEIIPQPALFQVKVKNSLFR